MPRRDTESPRKFLIPNASGASTAQPKRKMEAVRVKRLQANPTRRPRIKRRPPLAASVLPLACLALTPASPERATPDLERSDHLRFLGNAAEVKPSSLLFLLPILIGRNDLSSTNCSIDRPASSLWVWLFFSCGFCVWFAVLLCSCWPCSSYWLSALLRTQ
jgi:hypothetical protein